MCPCNKCFRNCRQAVYRSPYWSQAPFQRQVPTHTAWHRIHRPQFWWAEPRNPCKQEDVGAAQRYLQVAKWWKPLLRLTLCSVFDLLYSSKYFPMNYDSLCSSSSAGLPIPSSVVIIRNSWQLSFLNKAWLQVWITTAFKKKPLKAKILNAEGDFFNPQKFPQCVSYKKFKRWILLSSDIDFLSSHPRKFRGLKGLMIILDWTITPPFCHFQSIWGISRIMMVTGRFVS